MIVYIAGYGRSGSTILDIKLGKQFGFVSLGEVASIYSDLDDTGTARCGCGNSYSECELWHSLDRLDERQRRQKQLLLRMFQSPSPLRVFFHIAYRIRYRQSPTISIEAAATEPLKLAYQKYNDAIFIDSSKTAMFCATRPQLLKKYGFKVIVVHIVRPLKDVLSSIQKGDNQYLSGKSPRKKHLRKIRAVISYFLSNYYAKQANSIAPYIRISQLDLRNSESRVIKKISSFLQSHIPEAYTRYSANHLVSGNRLKTQFFAN